MDLVSNAWFEVTDKHYVLLYFFTNFFKIFQFRAYSFWFFWRLKRKQRSCFENSHFCMNTYLILTIIRLVFDLKTKCSFTIIFSIMLYLLSNLNASWFIIKLSYAKPHCICGKKLIEGNIGISKELSLFPYQNLKVSIMQLWSNNFSSKDWQCPFLLMPSQIFTSLNLFNFLCNIFIFIIL